VESQVVGKSVHLLEDQPRLVYSARSGQTLDVPVGAHAEGAFGPGEAVGRRRLGQVAIDRQSSANSAPMASIVASQRGSRAAMKSIIGMMSAEASSVSLPLC
jgi:hypothetical protein